ncbi:MAG TPA: maltose alpha-D-glucosyltransferase [Longimicrobiaceae bacterium]
MPGSDSLWYKDAVFYELHVKAFQDSNGDGIGDFRGLIDRLDYLQDLGIDVIWLLPFYPSPLRDDGYDIADYYGVNPQYGTIDDFQRFLDEAHQRDLKVIADLVLNHTSDQHPWFQRARRSPRGSPERNFYVWSDDDTRYSGARIIFTDSEPSNWTWDPVAEQYYWHRFFAHQPDLNWDNPVVKERMFEVMEYWLDRGLDGFRCDAVPYLIEREGTNCENLPETHQILKEFRARMDAKYPNRILLAEANQWPDDVRPYFGDGDEFHMAFHFPLMPRIFMAVRQGLRRPIVEIIERTPEIPPQCQWCMFLRNHDELTLEMVTDEERDYMYREYAADPRMRINLGIRRRLAPLMDNDRRKIELLNSILFTMPGSPIIYYGDELGMGDNIYVGDRDGVRTPMQWSPDRNAGFSRAEAARLYLPVIIDSVYGYQAINVEAQQRSPFSLLNWMKRLIQVRKQHQAFGRGSIEFLEPSNPHVLAYVREYEGDAILVVNNLAGTAQMVQLELPRFRGCVPVEMLGHTEFLQIDESPYALTLSPYGFFWFSLRRVPAPGEKEEEVIARTWSEQDAELLEHTASVAGIVGSIPIEWLRAQRWFRGKAREVVGIELADHVLLRPDNGPPTLLAFIRVRYAEEDPEIYTLALSIRAPAAGIEPLLTISVGSREVKFYDALQDPDSVLMLVDLVESTGKLATSKGSLQGTPTEALNRLVGSRLPVRLMSAEQSNTSVILGERLLLKVFRKLEDGINPDLEISTYLQEHTGFQAHPTLAGWIGYEGEQNAPLAGLFEFVENTGDAWAYTRKNLDRFFQAASRSAADPLSPLGREALRRMSGEYLDAARNLGELTGEMHQALASGEGGDPDFDPEPIGPDDVARWSEEFVRHVDDILSAVGRRLEAIPGVFPPHVLNALAAVVNEAPNYRELGRDIELLHAAGLVKTRYHGDFHLGQLLRVAGESPLRWVVTDFEGEPGRPLATRRSKHSPLRDVAGMLRSFDYAVRTAIVDHLTDSILVRSTLENWAEAWLREVRATFLAAYRQETEGAPFVPEDSEHLRRILRVFELEKAIYELGYEMNNRPDWIWVPVAGIRELTGGMV